MNRMRFKIHTHFFVPVFIPVVMALLSGTVAAEKEKNSDSSVTRISPPAQWDDEAERLFEGDPRQRLHGERPDRNAFIDEKSVSPATEVQNVSWDDLIPAEAVEDEIKSLYIDMGKPLARIGSYKSGGHQELEQRFAWVAAMFGILAQHGEANRWKEIAAPAAAHFSAASREAQVNNLQAFHNAKSRYEDLGQLIRGEKVDFDRTASLRWNEIIERPQLMQRLQQSYEQRLKRWAANQVEFEKNRLPLIHEAQIHAVLAEMIQQPSYAFSDDDDYLTHCNQLKTHAQRVSQAAQERNLEQVQQFLGELSKTCSRCHEAYK